MLHCQTLPQRTHYGTPTNDSSTLRRLQLNSQTTLGGPWRRSRGAWLSAGQVGVDALSLESWTDDQNCAVDYAQDHADLGAALNGFSLSEANELSAAIEKTGQAVDATFMSTTKLVRAL